MKKYKGIFLIIMCAILLLNGCGTMKNFYGEYVSINGKTKAIYSRDYVMMDCCKEWDDLVLFANLIPSASYVEAFEFYLYDEYDNKVHNTSKLNITIAPSERFLNEKATTTYAYFLNDLSPIEVTCQDYTYSFMTDKTGIVLLVKTNPNIKSVYIRNDEDCHGQCRSCSTY